jgi:pimeloyl-ACP methyl ester carboxylesterase
MFVPLAIAVIVFIGAHWLVTDIEKLPRRAADHPPERIFKNSRGHTYYEYLRGTNGKTVVFIHGITKPSYVFDDNFKAMHESGFSVLRYDLYGRGRSSAPEVKYDEAVYVEQLQGLLDYLKLERVSLVALSMGALVATKFTESYPSIVVSIVYVDPAGYPRGFSLFEKLIRSRGLGDLIFYSLGNRLLRKRNHQNVKYPEKIAGFHTKYAEQMQYRGFRRSVHATIRHMDFEMTAAFSSVTTLDIPISVIWGEDDVVVPISRMKYFLNDFPRAEFHVIKDTGHEANHENPEAVNPLLVKFLSRV